MRLLPIALICGIVVALVSCAAPFEIQSTNIKVGQKTYSDDASDVFEIIRKAMEAAGGLDGAASKIRGLTALIKTVMTSDGLTATILRSHIKKQLDGLKTGMISAQNKLVDHLLHLLEEDAGLRNHADEYGFIQDKIEPFIRALRKNLGEILEEIQKARIEADDETARELEKQADKVKNTLMNLMKMLSDKIFGNKETYNSADVTRGIISELRARMMEVMSMIREAKNAAAAAKADTQSLILSKIQSLTDEVQTISGELFETIMGHKRPETIMAGNLYASMLLSEHDDVVQETNAYVMEDLVRDAMLQLRIMIKAYLKKIAEAKNEIEKSTGEAKQRAMEHLADIQMKLKQATNDLMKTIFGRKTDEEQNENYIAEEFVKQTVDQLKKTVLIYIEKIKQAKAEIQRSTGYAKEIALKHMRDLQKQLAATT